MKHHESSIAARVSTGRFVTVLNYFYSAGIGRTGVLITMETALSLLDKGLPVSPLDIVKTLRDQRAMMVQTTVRRNSTNQCR